MVGVCYKIYSILNFMSTCSNEDSENSPSNKNVIERRIHTNQSHAFTSRCHKLIREEDKPVIISIAALIVLLP